MEPLSPVGRDERSTLAMENELPRDEVAHLRARLAATEAAAADVAAAATVGTPAGGADGDPAGGTGTGSPAADRSAKTWCGCSGVSMHHLRARCCVAARGSANCVSATSAKRLDERQLLPPRSQRLWQSR